MSHAQYTWSSFNAWPSWLSVELLATWASVLVRPPIFRAGDFVLWQFGLAFHVFPVFYVISAILGRRTWRTRTWSPGCGSPTSPSWASELSRSAQTQDSQSFMCQGIRICTLILFVLLLRICIFPVKSCMHSCVPWQLCQVSAAFQQSCLVKQWKESINKEAQEMLTMPDGYIYDVCSVEFPHNYSTKWDCGVALDS